MAGLKGVAPAMMIGFMIMIVITVIFVFDKKVELDEKIDIFSSARDVYRAVHATELLKRGIDSSADFAALTAARDLGLKGGGYDVWTAESPMLSDLEDSYVKLVTSKLDQIEAADTGASIEFDDARAEVLGYESNLLYLKGNKRFVYDTMGQNPEVHMEVDGKFNRTVATSYFFVLEAARTLFDDDFLNQSLLNGFEGQEGISPYDSNAGARAQGTANKVEDYLGEKYGLEYEIMPVITAIDEDTSTEVTVRTSVEITDMTSYVPSEAGEANLVLRFSTNFHYSFPKASSE